MKWFQHYSDSYTNLKLQEIVAEFGFEGYGIWWLCCELVAQQGVQYRITNGKNWKKVIMNLTHWSEDKLDTLLNNFAKSNLIDKRSLRYNILSIPKMEEYSDDYTNKIRRKSGHTPEKVPLDKSRVDKSRLDIKEGSPNGSPSSSSMKTTDETKHSDQWEEIIDLETGKPVQKILKETDPNVANIMWSLITWATREKRNGRFFPNLGKQFKALKILRGMNVSPPEIIERWNDLEEDKFYEKTGIDFMTVAKSYEKKA